MKHISDVLPKEVLNKYTEMYEGGKTLGEEDFKHFTRVFALWMIGLERDAVHANPNNMELSLSKTNYLGKKTRALLAVLEIKEPKTLGELKQTFVEAYGRKHHMGAPK